MGFLKSSKGTDARSGGGEARRREAKIFMMFERLREPVWGLPEAAAAPYPLNVCGGSGECRSPHNHVALYQVNRFRSELVAQTNARVDVVCLLAAGCSGGSVPGRICLKEAVG
jgi:hypothetical protein